MTDDLFDTPGTVAGQPPPTLADMRAALIRHDAASARNQQRTLGPSELGTPCDRQIALKLAGYGSSTAPEVKWAPMQGTAVHELMATVLRAENARLGRTRYLIEWRVECDDEISGTSDAYDLDTDTVIDWKLTGVTALRDAARGKVKQDYRVQAHLYGLGQENAGRTPKWVRLVFLARSHDFDQSVEWTEPYDRAVAERALGRFYRVRGKAFAYGPLDASIQPTPGAACTFCPFKDGACVL